MGTRKPDFIIKTAVWLTDDQGITYESKTDASPRLKNNQFANDLYRYMAKAVRALVSNQEGPDLPIKEQKAGNKMAASFKKRAARKLVS